MGFGLIKIFAMMVESCNTPTFRLRVRVGSVLIRISATMIACCGKVLWTWARASYRGKGRAGVRKG